MEQKRRTDRWSPYVFWGLLVLFAIIFAVSGLRVGCIGDEWIDGMNGKYSLEYYVNGDTTFMDYSKAEVEGIPVVLRYYGVGFEIIPATVIKLMPSAAKYEFEIRHLLCSVFTLLLILFSGLIGKYLKGYKLGIVVMLCVFLTPHIFGYSIFACKDIPPAAGFAIALYGMIRFLTRLPKFHFWDLFFMAAGMAVAMSVRVNGLMLCFYLFAGALLTIIFKKDIRKQLFTKPYSLLWRCLAACIMVCAVGIGIGLCFYPNTFVVGPVQHIKDAFFTISHFPQRIPMLFGGRQIDSLHLPDYYLLDSLLFTLPLFVWAGLFLCLPFTWRIWKRYDKVATLLLLFTIVFPVVYVIATKANIYNNWRHITFFYPGVAVFTAIGYYELGCLFKRRWMQVAYALIVDYIFAPTVVWLCKNHKYSYTFYNKLVPVPYANYDIDPSEKASVCAFDWLVNKHLCNKEDSVTVSAKSTHVERYQLAKQYPNIHVISNGVRGFSEVDCDYSIIHIEFLPKKVIRKFFPPQGTIHVETVDGKPICAVVKRNKLDIHGVQEIRKGNYAEGLRLLDSAYRYDPNNFTIWWWMGLGYYSTDDYQKAVQFFDQDLNFWPSSQQTISGIMYKGASLFYLKRYSDAIQTLASVEQNCGDNKPFVFAFMGMSHYHNKDYAKAVPYLQYAVQDYPTLNAMLADCRNR